MSIRPLDEIPQSLAGKRQSYREMIRADIQTAIDQGITKFEFEGDYNWKYLAQYAREEADNIWRKRWLKIIQEANAKHDLHCSTLPPYTEKGKYIKITSVKMGDRIHVYGQIYPLALERICGEVIEGALKEKEKAVKKMHEAADNKDLSVKIGDLPLSIRTKNVLLRSGISTVGDLQGKTYQDIIHMRNMGRKGAEETVELMKRFGLEVAEK